MTHQIVKILKLTLSGLILFVHVNCVGPTSPFGPIQISQKNKLHNLKSINTMNKVKNPATLAQENSINFLPKRQVLHEKFNLMLTINSTEQITSDSQFMFFYDDKDITNTFLDNATKSISADRRTLYLMIENLNLPPRRNNNIQVYFSPTANSSSLIESFETPVCKLNQQQLIKNTKPFTPETSILKWIKKYSEANSMNPSLVAGLIAQESSFDTSAVSWAKAIGLTQITSLAVPAVKRRHPNWKVSPHTKRLPSPVIKTLIQTGGINAKNDWRLHPERSIIGGITFLKSLEDYWRRASKIPSISKLYRESEVERTKVLLASYNSGAARVKYAMSKKGDNWLQAKKLNEARSYIKKIFSYCYHFGQKEISL